MSAAATLNQILEREAEKLEKRSAEATGLSSEDLEALERLASISKLLRDSRPQGGLQADLSESDLDEALAIVEGRKKP